MPSSSLDSIHVPGHAETAPPPPFGRGHFERLTMKGGLLTVSGWLFLPGVEAEHYLLVIDGKVRARRRPLHRGDVGRDHPAAGDHTGFRFHLPTPWWSLKQRWGEIEVIAVSDDRRRARIRTRFHPGYRTSLPQPPLDLMTRVSNIPDPLTYWSGGLQNFSEFRRGLEDAGESLDSGRRLLDWGCGCGRLISLFARYCPGVLLQGCDIDAAAIAWCRSNLFGTFHTIDPHPPTRFADASFDVVISYSVMTHLTRANQDAWRREIRRILTPGGLFLCTVHGEFAASFQPDRVRDAMARSGISDGTPDGNLDGIAPAGYYRGTYQQEAYTRRTWAEDFDVVEYRPRVMSNLQDLIIARSR